MSTKLKEKAVRMTNVRNCLAMGVTMAFAIVSGMAFAQDDLDDLLKDLEGTAAKPAEEAKPADAAAKSADATESADATSSSRFSGTEDASS